MTAGAERQLGIRASISGFVVHEDASLTVRMQHVFLRLDSGVRDGLAFLGTKPRQPAFSVSARPFIFYERLAFRLRGMLQQVPGWSSLMRIWGRIGGVLRYTYAIILRLVSILAAQERRFYPVIAFMGHLRLLYALVRHCWDDTHALPHSIITRKGWWCAYVVSLPAGILIVALSLYGALPVTDVWFPPAPPTSMDRPSSANMGAQLAEPAAAPINGEETQPKENEPPSMVEDVPPVPEVPWQVVNRAFPSFNLQTPELEGMELTYSVFSRGRYARRESMAWLPGSKHPEGSRGGRIYLTLERFEERVPPVVDFDADLTSRLTQDRLLIEKMVPVSPLVSKFGAMELADAMLTSGNGQAACLLFRYHDSIGFTLAGWFCGSPKKPVDRVSFTCFLDRLDLVQAGQDYPLRQLFAAAERNRNNSLHNCSSPRQPGRKMTWLDHEAPLPNLKLSTKHADTRHK